MNTKLIWVISIIVFALLLYLLMFINTNAVVAEVENIMYGNVDKSETEGTPLNMYNYSNIYQNAEVEVKITRLFTIHNFFDGYIWVKYSRKTIRNDIDIYPGAIATSCWKIHRENGKWKIVEIYEAP